MAFRIRRALIRDAFICGWKTRTAVLVFCFIPYTLSLIILPDLLGAVEGRPGLRPASVQGQMGDFRCYLVLGDAVLFPMFR